MRRPPTLQACSPADGHDSWKLMRVGHICVIALTRQPYGIGTYRLDRIARIGQHPTRPGKAILEVESGTPITLIDDETWDGQRHWLAYNMDTAPGPIRAADLWDAWVAAGSPSYRSARSIRDFIRGYIVREEAAA